MKTIPDHHDAEIILKLYDLRREAVMRESRSLMIREFLPRTYEDMQAWLQLTHPHNAALRQVSSYWEMAYGFARHGVVHAEMLAETGGEGIFLFAKVAPFLDRLRAEMSPTMLQNAEWMTKNTQAGGRYLVMFQSRVKKMLEAAEAKK